MPWHSRYIKPENPKAPSGGLRTTVVFTRHDLIWKSPTEIINPYTKDAVKVPLPLKNDAFCGPNILDVCQLAKVKVVDPQNPKKKIKVARWQIRDSSEFFEDPKKLKDDENEFSLRHYPFRSSLATSGSHISEDEHFITVEKKSSISISRLVYLIAVRLHDNSRAEATRAIGDLARSAWHKDLERSRKLYDLIISSKEGILDRDLDSEYRARSTISQEVESFILREACQLLSVDPDEGFQRVRGRPAGSAGKNHDTNDMSSAGEIVKLTLGEEGGVEGVFIVDYGGVNAHTRFETLTITKLALIMAALTEDALDDDAELVEAYLEAADENWRSSVSKTLGVNKESFQYNPYEVLGIEAGCSLKEAKNAYRRIVNVVHPDKGKLPDFYAQVARDAYEALEESLND